MYALIHDSQIVLGPIGFNYRMFNSELEELGLEYRVIPKDYDRVPIYFNDKTCLLPVVQNIPEYDDRLQEPENSEWEIIKENDIPIRVEFTYSIIDKSLEKIKSDYKQPLSAFRQQKENVLIDINLSGTVVNVSTDFRERLSFVTKLVSSPGPHKFKFRNGVWKEITTAELEYIISQIDAKVQEAFDWEYAKIQEIDACTTGEEVYNVIIEEGRPPGQ